MENSVILEILKNPNSNGLVVFVLGILFVLSIYHILLYFQQKRKEYLYYSLYTTLIFIAHLHDARSGFIFDLIKPISHTLKELDLDLTWIYNMQYFIFAYTFLNLKEFSKKWYRFIFGSILVLFVICTGFEITYRITGDISIINTGHQFFLVYLVILGIISYIPLFQMKTPLKYYILVGSTFLFGSSLTATFIESLNWFPDGGEISYSIFYIGVILENILFTLGLGHKQKLIMIEKNVAQKELIKQYKENDKLRFKINEQLQKDVANLNKEAEKKELETLKITFQNELTELKMASLRSQMNPHFIFNSLNSIKGYIIENEKENAIYYLNKFSKLIRKVLATTKEKEILLIDEIETMELYVSIENIRFKNLINFSIQIDDQLQLSIIKIPSLILQPFIENAIWHGLSLKKGEKTLQININKKDNTHIVIDIIDNGIGRKRTTEIMKNKSLKRESVGIKLTKERLAIFSKAYKNNNSVEIIDLYNNDLSPAGTQVTLMIPLL